MIIETPNVIYKNGKIDDASSIVIMRAHDIRADKAFTTSTIVRYLDTVEPLNQTISIEQCAFTEDILYVVLLLFKTTKVTITTPHYEVARLYADNAKERIDTTAESLKQQLPEVFL